MPDKRQNTDNIRMKIRFYIMSLLILFVLLFILTVDIPIHFGANIKFIGIIPLIKKNLLSIFFLLMAIIGVVLTCKSRYEWAGVRNPTCTINNIGNENYEYLTFLTTYIIPLICIDLTNIRYIIILCMLLVLIGSIFIKMDLYYGNPTLGLLGYRLYRAEIEGVTSPDGIILISQDRLSNNSKIEWIKIGEYVWVVKENK